MPGEVAAHERLATRLEEVLGAEEARTLMTLIAPARFDELATHDDVERLGVVLRGELVELREELRGEMGELRAELRGEMGELRAELRGEMGELREELRGEMGELRAELRGEMGELRAELREEMGELRAEERQGRAELLAAFRGEINEAVLRQGRTTAISLAASVIAIGGVAIAAGAM